MTLRKYKCPCCPLIASGNTPRTLRVALHALADHIEEAHNLTELPEWLMEALWG